MNIRFIDTSIVMNLLEIPDRCEDKEQVKREFQKAVSDGDRLVLPMSTIIESGNHIAHIKNGDARRSKALLFQEFLEKTACDETPWKLYGTELKKEDLLFIAQEFPERALIYEMGIGDLSIIRFYENAKKTLPALGKIMIWSTDKHLQGYSEDITMKRRKDR